ncbi:MAG: hypothetical protein ACI9L9_000291 [Marivirga sp.]|jgi:hypothetical protein
MKNTRITLLGTLLILLFSIGSYAQINNVADAGGKPLSLRQYNKIQGTPYYFGAKKWYNATIYLADGKQMNNVSIRYNAFADELEYERNGKILIIDSYNLRGFDFFVRDEITGGRSKYEFRNGFSVVGEIKPEEFYNVIYSGEEISLLEKVYVLESTVTPAAYGEASFTKFVAADKLILILSNEANDFKYRKKSFYNISPSNKDKIKAYIKKMDINLREPKDVAHLLTYIEKDLL